MSETLREAIERLAEEATQRAFPDIALIDALRAALAEHPATPADICACSHPGETHAPDLHAEVAEGERDALADALAPSLYEALMEATHDSWRQWRYLNAHGREKHRKHAAEIVADALMPTVAALTAKARAEALREAADEIGEGDGISRFIDMDSLPEAVRAEKRAQEWLRARADREASA